MPSLKTSTETPAEARVRRLQKTIVYASWWLMAQGALNLFIGPLFSIRFNFRFNQNMTPYMDQAAWALLGLGFFVNRAVREASRQYLAVDTLVLVFCGMVYSTLHYKLHGGEPFVNEWVGVFVNASLATALIVLRTKGSQMQASGLVGMDIVPLAKQGLAKLQGNLKREKPLSAPLPETAPAAVVEAAPEPPPAPVPVAVAPPKPKSEAMPHLD